MGGSDTLLGNKKLVQCVAEKKITSKFHSSRGRKISNQEHCKDKFLCSPSNITTLPPTDHTAGVRAMYLLFITVSLRGSAMSSFTS